MMNSIDIGRLALAVAIAVSTVVVHLPAQSFDDTVDSGNRRSNNPCSQLPEARGQAKGHDKTCDAAGASSGVARGDFNGDGIGDLAVGVPYEDIGNVKDAGAVNVIYGSTNGLTTGGGTTGVPADQFWHQNSPGMPGASETDDRFGWSLASGNFNGDAYSDLAIGTPYEDIDDESDTGAVYVLYGSASGLTTAGVQSLDVRVRGAILLPSLNFGYALTWGDFNGDSIGDLAIGEPGREQRVPLPCVVYCDSFRAGQVLVLYGAAGIGLRSFGNQTVAQATRYADLSLYGNDAESLDEFGSVLAAGDFDDDGFDDLVVGVPFENHNTLLGQTLDTGMIQVIYGSDQGLEYRFQGFSQASGVIGTEEEGDRFGQSLAVGDFNGDGHADLAVGAPHESIGDLTDAGDVFIFYGDSGGLNPSTESWYQDKAGIKGESENGDRFGFAVAAGDFNGDTYSDLAIGAPFENHSGVNDAGMVHVIYGSGSGLTDVGDELWYQGVDLSFGTGTPRAGDKFGFSLTAWNFGKGSARDLVIGVPGKTLFNISAAGMVHVVYGSNPGGLTVTGNQFWHQGHLQSTEGIETGDQFGGALY